MNDIVVDHRIRLTSAWTISAAESQPRQRADARRPWTELFGESFLGDTVCYERIFHPPPLDSHQRLALVIKSFTGTLTVVINDNEFGTFQPQSTPVRLILNDLKQTNQRVRLELSRMKHLEARITEDIWLEIFHEPTC